MSPCDKNEKHDSISQEATETDEEEKELDASRSLTAWRRSVASFVEKASPCMSLASAETHKSSMRPKRQCKMETGDVDWSPKGRMRQRSFCFGRPRALAILHDLRPSFALTKCLNFMFRASGER